ncbi:MAG: hypothetical protein PSY14_00605 [bacterium]|nr:hypothetical protein [bacterium]
MFSLRNKLPALFVVIGFCSVLLWLANDSVASSQGPDDTVAVHSSATTREMPPSITDADKSAITTLDGVDFYRHQLIFEFLNTAFSAFVDDKSISSFFQCFSRMPDLGRQAFKRSYPWLYGHIYHDESSPKHVAINKWTQAFTISFGYPNDLKPSTPMGEREVVLINSDLPAIDMVANNKIKEGVGAYIQQLLPSLRNLTNLDITFDPQQTDKLGIKIIFVNATAHWETPYKRGDKSSVVNSETPSILMMFPEAARLLFPNAVYFTPESMQQVEGFLLPNKNNELEYAFCFIAYNHPKLILEGLVRECIVRSLGLPGAVKNSPKFLLSKWNDKQSWNNYYQKQMTAAPPPFGELDRLLVKTLYSPEIKTGSSPQTIVKTLHK